jgi:hypothetical protein
MSLVLICSVQPDAGTNRPCTWGTEGAVGSHAREGGMVLCRSDFGPLELVS